MSVELKKYIERHRMELICAGEVFREDMDKEFGDGEEVESLKQIINELNKEFGV